MKTIETLWGDPYIEPPPPPKPTPAERRRKQRLKRLENGPTDVLFWLSLNEPQDFAELMDLRRTLYSFRSRGQYTLTLGEVALDGSLQFTLKGPASTLQIRSDKSRYFLLRTLCRLRIKRGWPPIRYKSTRHGPY